MTTHTSLDVAQRGNAVASQVLGHSVHVEVDGLEPGRWYWYRFRSGADESTVGRTRPSGSSSMLERQGSDDAQPMVDQALAGLAPLTGQFHL